MGGDITQINVINWEPYERVIRGNRWYIRIRKGEKTRTLPLANYVWLKNNPTFKGIPRGYVIHHLDLNELNDDISNLALMFKHHHTAYHLKHLNAPVVPIQLDVIENGIPLRKPKIAHKKRHSDNKDLVIIRYPSRENGEVKYLEIYNKGRAGQHFRDEHDAQKYINRVWPDKPWERKPPQFMVLSQNI